MADNMDDLDDDQDIAPPPTPKKPPTPKVTGQKALFKMPKVPGAPSVGKERKPETRKRGNIKRG